MALLQLQSTKSPISSFRYEFQLFPIFLLKSFNLMQLIQIHLNLNDVNMIWMINDRSGAPQNWRHLIQINSIVHKFNWIKYNLVISFGAKYNNINAFLITQINYSLIHSIELSWITCNCFPWKSIRIIQINYLLIEFNHLQILMNQLNQIGSNTIK